MNQVPLPITCFAPFFYSLFFPPSHTYKHILYFISLCPSYTHMYLNIFYCHLKCKPLTKSHTNCSKVHRDADVHLSFFLSLPLYHWLDLMFFCFLFDLFHFFSFFFFSVPPNAKFTMQVTWIHFSLSPSLLKVESGLDLSSTYVDTPASSGHFEPLKLSSVESSSQVYCTESLNENKEKNGKKEK